jgi:hypothetical protein
MVVKFVFFLFAFSYYCAISQSLTTIQGQLLDLETNAPVVFANVYTNGSGTSSNQLGRFNLSFYADQKDTLLTISCIGYETKRISLKNFKKENVIFLEPKTEVLREVMITALTPKQILKKAEKALLRNFSTSAFSAKFELEQCIFEDDVERPLGYSHTNGLLNDRLVDSAKVYPKVRIDSISISTGFLSYDTITNFGFNVVSPFAHSLSPYFFFSTLNPVKHFLSGSPYQEEFFESVKITLEGMMAINGEEHYSISLVSKKPDKMYDKAGFFLINAKDFGIRNVVIKLNGYSPDGRVLGKAHVSASYEKIKGKYFLSNMDILLTKISNPMLSVGTTDMNKAFYINSIQMAEIKTKKIDRITKKSEMSKGRDAHYKNFPHLNVTSDSTGYVNWSFIMNGDFLKPIRDCSSCELNANLGKTMPDE